MHDGRARLTPCETGSYAKTTIDVPASVRRVGQRIRPSTNKFRWSRWRREVEIDGPAGPLAGAVSTTRQGCLGGTGFPGFPVSVVVDAAVARGSLDGSRARGAAHSLIAEERVYTTSTRRRRQSRVSPNVSRMGATTGSRGDRAVG